MRSGLTDLDGSPVSAVMSRSSFFLYSLCGQYPPAKKGGKNTPDAVAAEESEIAADLIWT